MTGTRAAFLDLDRACAEFAPPGALTPDSGRSAIDSVMNPPAPDDSASSRTGAPGATMTETAGMRRQGIRWRALVGASGDAAQS